MNTYRPRSVQRRLKTLVIVVSVAAAVTSTATAQRTVRGTSFPCRWNYDMYVGLRAGYVTGSENADCTGHQGTLTLIAQLFRSTPATAKWRLDRSETQSWRNPLGNRYVEFDERCSIGKTRATFTWALRDPGGRVVAHMTIKTSPVADPGPRCAYVLR